MEQYSILCFIMLYILWYTQVYRPDGGQKHLLSAIWQQTPMEMFSFLTCMLNVGKNGMWTTPKSQMMLLKLPVFLLGFMACLIVFSLQTIY